MRDVEYYADKIHVEDLIWILFLRSPWENTRCSGWRGSISVFLFPISLIFFQEEAEAVKNMDLNIFDNHVAP